MATIKTIIGLPLRQLRAEPTAHVLRFKQGELIRQGAGLNFFFLPHNTGLAEVPVDNQEIPFLCHARTRDFQDVTVQGVVTYRVADPATVARHIDFTIDNAKGHWTRKPLERLAGLVQQLVQQITLDHCAARDLRAALTEGVTAMRDRIQAGLDGEATLDDVGVEIAVVRVTGVAPTAELEKALQKKTREAIQQEADEATFARRALAVEKERAIAENELKNQVELAMREHELFERQGENAREQAEQGALVTMITARADDQRAEMLATRKAADIKELDDARLAGLKQRAAVDADLGAELLMARAFRELATHIGGVQNITITPDLLTNLVTGLGLNAKGEAR